MIADWPNLSNFTVPAEDEINLFRNAKINYIVRQRRLSRRNAEVFTKGASEIAFTIILSLPPHPFDTSMQVRVHRFGGVLMDATMPRQNPLEVVRQQVLH